MRLRFLMHKSIVICFLLFCNLSFAQTCPVPDKKVVIFFGNGINTEQFGATQSRDLLRFELGDTYNGQTLRYDLAYNKTSGMALDLGQSVLQAGVQFDSQIMGWFNNIGVAPNWFNQWYQQFTVTLTNVIADEVLDHVDKYSAAIRHGQKVLVVAHSQGTFYVNAAKIQLAQQLSPEQMQSFATFGVAVPANNVGGSSSPYYTNHRDIIQYVPGALSPNWTLQRSNGTSADDVGLVQAHLFNDTYISSDFDVRPALLIGIKGQIGGAATPTPSCDDYRKYFLAPLAGTYPGTCNGSKTAASISAEAVALFPNGPVDMSLETVNVGYVLRQIVNTSAFGDNTGIGLAASGNGNSVGGRWSIDGTFQDLARDGMSCSKTADVPMSTISSPLDIAVRATTVMKNFHTSYPGIKCAWLDKVNSVYLPTPKRVQVSLQGSTLSVGELVLDLTGGRASESVAIPSATSFVPVDFEPQFSYSSTDEAGSLLFFNYKQNKGLTSLRYDRPTSSLSCTF
jgi:hypothetical protein